MPRASCNVSAVDPIKRGLKESLTALGTLDRGVVSAVDPIKRGLKDNHQGGVQLPPGLVSAVDPIKRGLKEAMGVVRGVPFMSQPLTRSKGD